MHFSVTLFFKNIIIQVSFPEIASSIQIISVHLYSLSYRVTADGSTLNIYGALPSDMGKYTCVATNPAGEEDRIFNLNVYGKYEISSSFGYAALESIRRNKARGV